MAAGAFGVEPFSTNVELWLETPTRRVPLAQVGDTFVVTAEECDIPPGRATLVISIDGVRSERPVDLITGHGHSRELMMLSVDESAPF